MTRSELLTLLKALFGSQIEAANKLNTSRDTISKWGRDNPVPPAVAALLLMLDSERNNKPKGQSMRTVIFAALMAAIAMPAHAATLKPASPACISEEMYDQLLKAAYSQDMEALAYLSGNGCSVSDKPLHATVLGLSSWGSLAHVRVYRGSHAVEVWTAREHLDGYDPLSPSVSR